MSTPLAQQVVAIEAARRVVEGTAKPPRQAERGHISRQLSDAAKTIRLIQANESEIRDLIRSKSDGR